MPNTTARGAALLVLAAGLLAGCATHPAVNRDPRDPWEPFNRKIWAFDLAFVRTIAVPVDTGYRGVTPRFVRTGIGNFMDNIVSPRIIVNDLLQGKFKPFLTDTGRFVMNSTIGLGGLLDPASHTGALPKNDNDFGITLGTWGAGPGPYLVLPFIGMSDVRDISGRVPDYFLSPTFYVNNTWVWVPIDVVYLFDVNSRTLIPNYELLKSQNPFDEYAFARNAYLSQREYRIHGQSAKSEEQQELELEKSLEDSDSSPAPKGAPAKEPPKP
jgi:phospholipid-binding lipoprotein MlaA